MKKFLGGAWIGVVLATLPNWVLAGPGFNIQSGDLITSSREAGSLLQQSLSEIHLMFAGMENENPSDATFHIERAKIHLRNAAQIYSELSDSMPRQPIPDARNGKVEENGPLAHLSSPPEGNLEDIRTQLDLLRENLLSMLPEIEREFPTFGEYLAFQVDLDDLPDEFLYFPEEPTQKDLVELAQELSYLLFLTISVPTSFSDGHSTQEILYSSMVISVKSALETIGIACSRIWAETDYKVGAGVEKGKRPAR